MKLFFKSLTLAVITSTCISNIAFADIPFTKDDLIGKWQCYDHDPELQFRAESVIENRADGTHSENSVMYFDDEASEYHQINKTKLISKWALDGDVMSFYDAVISYYEVDMPNYDEESTGISKYGFMIFNTVINRAELEKSIVDDLSSKIKFIDKNTYIYTSVEEDFLPVEQGYCKRVL